MSEVSRFQRRAWQIIGPTKEGDYVSRAFDIFMTALIAVNVLAVMWGTVEGVNERYDWQLEIFEAVSVAIFGVEYLLSVWVCTADPRFSRPIAGRLKYVTTPLALLDLLAILPFFVVFLAVDLRFLRALRLMRAVRLFKSARYLRALRTLGRVATAEKHNLIGAALILMVVLVMSGSLMYFAERDAQPELFSSIPDAMWWGVSALVKVKLSDMQPITMLGKVLGAFLAFWGVGLVALPAGILSSGFIEDMRKEREAKAICPHCGKGLHAGQKAE